MKRIGIYSAFLFAIVLASCSTNKNVVGKSASFYEFDETSKLSFILEQASSRNKLVFLDFHASWCLPCKVMDEQIDRDPTLKRAIKEDYITYKVDGEAGVGPDLMVIFAVKAFPTYLFLDPGGKVLGRQEGTMSNQELFELTRASKRQTD